MTAPTLDVALATRRPDDAAPTRKACETARLFGMSLDEPDSAAQSALSPIRLRLRTGEIALLSGPSGGGKSTMLRQAVAAAREQVWPVWRIIEPARLRPRPGALVDQFAGGAGEAVARLARVGLGEARRLVARPAALSDGERWRLSLALALDKAHRAADQGEIALLAVDEFAATLDRATATSVARLLRRLVDANPRLAVIVATSHDDIRAALAPDIEIRTSLRAAPAVIQPGALRVAAPRLTIERGSIADYDALSALHYRARRPATWPCVLRALARPTRGAPPEVVGALVVSMPTLNGRWRNLAWPGRYAVAAAGSQRGVVRRLNAELRCISRVVVDPRYRSAGAATTLVRAYLRSPRTIHTEAVAAMGRFTAFFERAGMTAYPLAPTPRDLRLLDALRSAGVESWRLATPRAAWRRALNGASEAFLARELSHWAHASRSPAGGAQAAPETIFRIAARAIAAQPIAYAHAAGLTGKE